MVINLLKANRYDFLAKKDFNIDTVPNETMKQNAEQGDSIIHLLIAKSIPDELESILPPNLYELPLPELLECLDSKFIRTSKQDHAILRAQAKSLTYKSENGLKEYYDKL